MNSVMRYRRWVDKPAYAVARMCIAIERMVSRGDRTAHHNDAAWIVAWAVAAGVKAPDHLKLRPTHRTRHDEHLSLARRRQDRPPATEHPLPPSKVSTLK